MPVANNDLYAVLCRPSPPVLPLHALLQEVEVLLLQHHHAAEPQNTTQQAGVFHTHSRYLWLQGHSRQQQDSG